MYYDLIEISARDRAGGREWVVTHSQVSGDRQPRPGNVYTPSTLGFFHYPRKWGVEKGLRVLKAAMMKRHKVEIADLTKSLAKLRSVKLPKKG